MAQLLPVMPYQAMPTVVPYVSRPARASPQSCQHTILRRMSWYKPWYSCWGECDKLGLCSCTLSWCCPCVVFGLNRNRAFSQSALLWMVLFLLMFVMSFNSCTGTFTVLGLMINGTALFSPSQSSVSGDQYQYSENNYIECSGSKVSAVGSWMCWIAIIVLGVMNRTSLRMKFGLEGKVSTDCLLWTFCPYCALCQETRTLSYNSVTDGVWRGPSQVYVPRTATGPNSTATPHLQQVFIERETPANPKEPINGEPQVMAPA